MEIFLALGIVIYVLIRAYKDSMVGSKVELEAKRQSEDMRILYSFYSREKRQSLDESRFDDIKDLEVKELKEKIEVLKELEDDLIYIFGEYRDFFYRQYLNIPTYPPFGDEYIKIVMDELGWTEEQCLISPFDEKVENYPGVFGVEFITEALRLSHIGVIQFETIGQELYSISESKKYPLSAIFYIRLYQRVEYNLRKHYYELGYTRPFVEKFFKLVFHQYNTNSHRVSGYFIWDVAAKSDIKGYGAFSRVWEDDGTLTLILNICKTLPKDVVVPEELKTGTSYNFEDRDAND